MGDEPIGLAILEKGVVPMVFDDTEFALLRECVSRQAPELTPLLRKIEAVPLTNQEREKLRGAVAAELCETGLTLRGGPNERGLALDDLIDLLGHV